MKPWTLVSSPQKDSRMECYRGKPTSECAWFTSFQSYSQEYVFSNFTILNTHTNTHMCVCMCLSVSY